ncbi:uncharacterized protein LOC143447525 [Clavelina lepadiformis]|uniref:uncharacterized protein LOC143447525 n=1 Tax=Clavelina lepadiformis TaxID=159417 RepID=UPI0040420B67
MLILPLVIIHVATASCFSFNATSSKPKSSATQTKEVVMENPKLLTEGNKTKNNRKIKKIWIESVMLRHILHWDPVSPSSRYTVLYRKKFGQTKNWEEAPTCSKIKQTTCDLSSYLQTPLEYIIGVTTEPFKEQYVGNISFWTERDTILIPPTFSAIRRESKILLRMDSPRNHGKNGSIAKDLATLNFQVDYWPGNDTSKTRTQYLQVKQLEERAEFVLTNLSKWSEYCIKSRLVELSFMRLNQTTGKSNWTKVLCLKPIEFLTSTSNNKQVVLLTIVSLAAICVALVVLFLAYKSWKMYKFIHMVDDIPEELERALHEMECSNEGEDSLKNTSPISERVDEILHSDVENLTLEEKEFVRASCFCKCETACKAQDTDARVLENSVDTKKHDFINKLRRQRSRSRGYHSASSESTLSSFSSETDFENHLFISSQQAETSVTSEISREKPMATEVRYVQELSFHVSDDDEDQGAWSSAPSFPSAEEQDFPPLPDDVYVTESDLPNYVQAGEKLLHQTDILSTSVITSDPNRRGVQFLNSANFYVLSDIPRRKFQ